MLRRTMKPLHLVTALVLLTAGLIASSVATVSAAGAGLNQPTASCSSTRASVTFTWRPAPGSSAQWLDVSTSNNGFARGTFESEGPFNGSRTSYVWDGLKSGTTYFWRVNSNTVNGWEPSETGTYTPCPGTAGVNYVFGTNVSQADQAAVRDAIKVSSDLAKELLGYDPPNYTVHAYHDVAELVEAAALWVEDPSPTTRERIRQRYQDLLILGAVFAGDGMFISTWVEPWTQSRTYRYLVIGHEYFHIVQAGLRGTPASRGTPLWLSEGSAEYFGALVFARKTGTDYSNLRDLYIRDVAGVTESLLALESGGRFSQIANDSYPLAMLAFEYLIKDKGWKAVVDYYRAIGRRQEWQGAFTQAFGTPYESFAGAFESYRQNGYR